VSNHQNAGRSKPGHVEERGVVSDVVVPIVQNVVGPRSRRRDRRSSPTRAALPGVNSARALLPQLHGFERL
jgi:hypothetical protein